RGKVLKTARQRKSKIQPVEGTIPLQAIKRKIDPLQDVEVNNKRTLENGKKIKMKHEATQESTERTESGYRSKHPNRGAEPKCKSKYSNRNRRNPNTTMESDIQHVTNLETEENLEKGKKNTQKMDTEEISEKREPTKQEKGYPIVQFSQAKILEK
ncbi:17316_t:CDS:2, partial [Gigaspora margarita]